MGAPRASRFCVPHPKLVGVRCWLPTEPFEFGWAYHVGCNNLRCERCGEPVRSEVAGPCRRYVCGCQHWEASWTHGIGEDTWDVIIEIYHPDAEGWVCRGHPPLVLPTTLDGMSLDTATDWDALVYQAIWRPPLKLPAELDLIPISVSARWLIRLYWLLDAERPLLRAAVRGLFDAQNTRVARAVQDFVRLTG